MERRQSGLWIYGEDEMAVRMMSEMILKAYRPNITLEAYSDPDRLIETFLANPQRYDLVITDGDYGVQKKNGLEVAAILKKETNFAVPVILHSFTKYDKPGQLAEIRNYIDLVAPKGETIKALANSVEKPDFQEKINNWRNSFSR